MKYLFSVILILLVSASYAQNEKDPKLYIYTKSLEGKTFREIILRIEPQLPFSISYSDNIVNPNQIHHFSSESLYLDQFLDQICSEQGISYLFSDQKLLFIERIDNGIVEDDQSFGFVRDKETGEALIGAIIYNSSKKLEAFTNNFGFYSLNLKKNQDSITFTYIGYKPKTLSAKVLKGRTDIALSPSLTFEEIIVTPQFNLIENATQFVQFNLNKPKNSTFGDEDVLQSMKRVASIQSGSEVQGNLLVRGGGHDQNLILMDDTPLYEVNHLLGIISIFNNDAINNADFSADGFSAKYGGRLSSVINIDLKSGNLFRHKANLNIGLIGAKIHVEGPIKSGVSSFNVSARRSYINTFIKPIAKRFLDIKDTRFGFYDVNMKVSYKISRNGTLHLSGYYGSDQVGFIDETVTSNGINEMDSIRSFNSIRWKNEVIGLRYRHVFGEKLFTNISYSRVDYTLFSQSQNSFVYKQPNHSDSEVVSIFAYSSINDHNFRNDWEYTFSNNHIVKFGGAFSRHRYNPAIRERQEVVIDGFPTNLENQNDYTALEYQYYFEDIYRLNSQWLLKTGAHLSGFLLDETEFHSFQPRFQIQYNPNNIWAFQLNYTQMVQFVHLLVNPGIGLPSDLWVPSTVNTPPQQSTQYSLVINRFIKPDFLLGASIYYKSLDNLVEYQSAYDLYNPVINNSKVPVFNNSRDWEDRVVVGKGNAYGLELSSAFTLMKHSFDINYALGYSFREFEGINMGKPFPFRNDRRHDFNISWNYNLNKKISMNMLWVYGSGHAVTLALTEFETEDGIPILNFSERNNFRLPAYHKLDYSFTYKNFWGSDWRYTIAAGLQNIYNRKNAYYIYLYKDNVSNSYIPKKVSIFPILPFLNVTFYLD